MAGDLDPPMERLIDSDGDAYHPFAEFQRCGLLWLANVAAFAPRGYAVAFHYDSSRFKEAIGWSFHGDGTVPWEIPVLSETTEMMRRSKLVMP
jgi:hypothetical protein